jgi:hypothetical protein
MGATNRWHSSTNPDFNAWEASSGPPTVRSLAADALIRRTASGSKSLSTRVSPMNGLSSVLEYTIFSAACQI